MYNLLDTGHGVILIDYAHIFPRSNPTETVKEGNAALIVFATCAVSAVSLSGRERKDCALELAGGAP